MCRYMIPGMIVALDQLPQTASSKINRKELELLYTNMRENSFANSSVSGIISFHFKFY